jgi:carbon-monoxide dehydrogenase large subunit
VKGIGNPRRSAPRRPCDAVVDAVSHLGVRHIDLPLSPEQVWARSGQRGRRRRRPST